MLSKYDIIEALIEGSCYSKEAILNFSTEFIEGKYLGTPVSDKLNSATKLAHFISQLTYESRGMTRLKENTNYSRDRITEIFGKYCTSESRLDQMDGSEEFLFNTVYGGRMGNDEPGDGYKFIGRGYVMRTGKDNYRALSRLFGIDFEQDPGLLENHRFAFYGALAYFDNRKYSADKNTLLEASDYLTVRQVTRLVNGGTHGLEGRELRFSNALASLEGCGVISNNILHGSSSWGDTMKAQLILSLLGFNVGEADGYFGNKTLAAYNAFKSEFSVEASLTNLYHELYLILE